MSAPAIDRLPVRVYYEDTDFSGVVYHASYLRFLERGRTEVLRARGIGQRELMAGPEPLGFAVATMEIAFRKPARMDDLVTVETEVAEIGGASVTMKQRITRDGDLLVSALVRVAAVARGRPARLPPALAARLRGEDWPS